MLTCVFHPLDGMRVVEEHEAERLIELGVWFDSPLKASEYRSKIERDIRIEKKKSLKSNDKLGEKSNER